MNRDLANSALAKIRQRISEGDCPTTPAYSVEHLEELVVHFASQASPGTSVLTLTSEVLSEAVGVLRRIETYAPDLGVDEFQDALRDARAIITKAEA